METTMTPWMRWWFNLHRHNTRLRKDRNMHKLERMLFALPAKAYVRWQHAKNRLRAKQTEPPTGGFLTPGNSQEE